MSDYRDLLERERRRFRMPHGSMEGLERRRDRKRRNRRIASGIVALVIAAAGLGAGLYALRPAGNDKPVVTPTPTVAPPSAHRVLAPSGPIQFVDAKTGWAVGPNGEILATVDGGKTWSGQYSGPLRIVGVQFVDDLHGWALAEGGLLRTVDGGGSWGPVTGQSFTTVQFVNSRTGWGISFASHGPPSTHLWMTPDGGETWFRREGAGLAADSVCALNEKVIWAAGTGQGGRGLVLAKSDDGGVSWADTPIPVPQGEPWTATVRCAGIDVWVLVQDGGAAGHLPYALFHTAEGGPDVIPVLQEGGTRPLGNVKNVADAQDPYPGPFVAFDGVDALLIGWCPPCGNSMALYGAGAGWTPPVQLVKQGATPLGMSFADRNHGWILFQKNGPKGLEWTVMATSDGGKTWSTLG
jgi:photosystem II stability/assembly factor-like uncharacterized protein